MLPPTPGLTAGLPTPAIILGALALVLGVGVRPIAILLKILAPIGGNTIASDALYWLLMLGFLAIDGAGVLAVDTWLAERLRGMIPAPRKGAHHVVIVGGGFGGCAVAQGLAGRDCSATLIDRHNYHLFQPLLYQVATAGLSPADIATPIRGLFRAYGNIRVRLGTVTGVDTSAKAVELGAHRIAYDTLVLATGAQHAYFGHDEWASLAPGLKTIDDATAVRRRLAAIGTRSMKSHLLSKAFVERRGGNITTQKRKASRHFARCVAGCGMGECRDPYNSGGDVLGTVCGFHAVRDHL